MRTISDDTSPLTAVFFVVAGGKFRFKRVNGFIRVLDEEDKVIGLAHPMSMGGYAVHTRPFAGHVDESQVVWVNL